MIPYHRLCRFGVHPVRSNFRNYIINCELHADKYNRRVFMLLASCQFYEAVATRWIWNYES